MDLILWRHADAEDGIHDSERKLTPKGIKQAARMAKWLRARTPDTAVVLVSPAKRAQQTARALTANFKTVAELGLAASAEGVLRAAGWLAKCVSLGSHLTMRRRSSTALFKLLGDPTRLVILERLARLPRTAGELARELPVSRSAVAQHLTILKQAGLK